MHTFDSRLVNTATTPEQFEARTDGTEFDTESVAYADSLMLDGQELSTDKKHDSSVLKYEYASSDDRPRLDLQMAGGCRVYQLSLALRAGVNGLLSDLDSDHDEEDEGVADASSHQDCPLTGEWGDEFYGRDYIGKSASSQGAHENGDKENGDNENGGKTKTSCADDVIDLCSPDVTPVKSAPTRPYLYESSPIVLSSTSRESSPIKPDPTNQSSPTKPRMKVEQGRKVSDVQQMDKKVNALLQQTSASGLKHGVRMANAPLLCGVEVLTENRRNTGLEYDVCLHMLVHHSHLFSTDVPKLPLPGSAYAIKFTDNRKRDRCRDFSDDELRGFAQGTCEQIQWVGQQPKVKCNGKLVVRHEKMNPDHLPKHKSVYRTRVFMMNSDGKPDCSKQIVWYQGEYDPSIFQRRAPAKPVDDRRQQLQLRITNRKAPAAQAALNCGPHTKAGVLLDGNPDIRFIEQMKTRKEERECQKRARKMQEKGEIEKMISVCDKIEQSTGHKWMQYHCDTGDGLEFFVFYHAPVMEAVSKWCCADGDLDSQVPCLYQDCTFSEGNYLVSKLWTKCHHFEENPVVCVATIVCLRERAVVYDKFWEFMVKQFPLLKVARVIGCDLAHIEDSGIAKHIPHIPGKSGFRAKCDRHGRQVFVREARDAGEKKREAFWVNQYELMIQMSKHEFEVHDKAILNGEVEGCSSSFIAWWTRQCKREDTVRAYIRDWMRVECLHEIGFPKGWCTRFTTNPAEGGNNGYKCITRSLWNNFVKRGIFLDQMVEADYVWIMATWNVVLLCRRGEKKEFGRLKEAAHLIPGDCSDLAFQLPDDTAHLDVATGLKKGPWECQLESYIRDLTAGRRDNQPTYNGEEQMELDVDAHELPSSEMLQPSDALTSDIMIGSQLTQALDPLPSNKLWDKHLFYAFINKFNNKLTSTERNMAIVNAALDLSQNWKWTQHNPNDRIESHNCRVYVIHNPTHDRTTYTVDLFVDVHGRVGTYKAELSGKGTYTVVFTKEAGKCSCIRSKDQTNVWCVHKCFIVLACQLNAEPLLEHAPGAKRKEFRMTQMREVAAASKKRGDSSVIGAKPHEKKRKTDKKSVVDVAEVIVKCL